MKRAKFRIATAAGVLLTMAAVGVPTAATAQVHGGAFPGSLGGAEAAAPESLTNDDQIPQEWQDAGEWPDGTDLTLSLSDEQFAQLTRSAALTSAPTAESVGLRAVILNGCSGFTDLPHLSSNGYDASVHGRTSCPGAATKQNTTALYRIDWWGDNLMNRVTGSVVNKTGTLRVPVHANCDKAPNRGYRGVSNHLADYLGKRGTATTGAEAWFSCQ